MESHLVIFFYPVNEMQEDPARPHERGIGHDKDHHVKPMGTYSYPRKKGKPVVASIAVCPNREQSVKKQV